MDKSVRTILPVGLIGPVLPFRGGIAQHTTMLHRALLTRSDLCTISFKRQYPKFLYPGKSDRDPEYAGHSEAGALYVLDYMNPFTWVSACKRLLEHSPRLVVIVWCTFFGAPCLGFMAKYLRKRGVRVMFLCHNVTDHESSFWKGWISRMALSQGDSYLVHTNSEKKKLNNLLPGADVIVHPHPISRQFPLAEKHLPRRAGLELLFFGFVRHYKGLDVLVDALKLLHGEDVFLTVAGEWWGNDVDLKRSLKSESIEPRVEVIDRYVSEEETAEFFQRADYVVLPYRSATGTGVIPLAYHYGKPVIAARTGGIPEVVIDGVSGRLFQPENPEALAEVVRELMHASPEKMREGARKAAEQMTWKSFTTSILDQI